MSVQVGFNKSNMLARAFGIVAGVIGGAGFALQHSTLDAVVTTVFTGAVFGNVLSKIRADASDRLYTSAVFGASLATAVVINQTGLPPLMPSGFPLKIPGVTDTQTTSASQKETISFVGRTMECLNPEPVTNDRGYPQYRLPAHCTVH